MAATLSAVLGRTFDTSWFAPESISSPDMRAMFGFLTDTGYTVDLPHLRRGYPGVGWQSFRS